MKVDKILEFKYFVDDNFHPSGNDENLYAISRSNPKNRLYPYRKFEMLFHLLVKVHFTCAFYIRDYWK